MNTQIYQKFLRKLWTKYEINPNSIMISKVIKKIPCHLLNQVIDNDIYYNHKDFIKAYYSIHKCQMKLKRLLTLFSRYAQIYPNYSLLPEAQFLYWNINHKQMLINQYEKLENNKDREKNTKIIKLLKKKENDKTTFFEFSVLKEVYNTSIFNEIFFNNKKNTLNINTEDEGEDVLLLIGQIDKIEKEQIIQKEIKSKQELNISGFWINNQNKYIQSQAKNAYKQYIINDHSNPCRYSSITSQKQKPKTPQINIKLNSFNMAVMNKTLQSSFNNTSNTPYNNKTIVTIENYNRASTIRKAILTNQIVSSRSFRANTQKINTKLITNIPLISSCSKSPRIITANKSLLHFKKPCTNYPSANTSRINTIHSLNEAMKLKLPLNNLKLNPKVISRIKLKIEKQKGK